MNRLTRWTPAVLLACLVGLAQLSQAAPADDRAPVDVRALDQYMFHSLRFVINHGVDLYNAGDIAACNQHFRRTLESLAPLLGHRPELKKLVETGLAEVDKNEQWRLRMAGLVADGGRPAVANPTVLSPERQKAFALRAVLNDVREGLKTERKPPEPARTDEKKPPEKKPEEKKPPEKKPEEKKPEEKKPMPPAKPDEKKPPEKKPEEKKPEMAGEVTGRVTFKGQPASGIKVTFVDAAGKSFAADVDVLGSYRIMNLPPGEYRVTFTSPPDKGVKLPEKYGKVETSGVKVEVKSGKNARDIDLQ